MVSAAVYGYLVFRIGFGGHFEFLQNIRVGSVFVEPSRLLPGQLPTPGRGYDGQFNFVIAQDPFLTSPDTSHSLDNTLRYRRILYPLLTWMFSLGHRVWVPTTLVAVNLAASIGLVAVLARQAVRMSANPWWSLSVAIYSGVWTGIIGDLTEPTQLFFLALGVAANSAALTLVSALAKETSAVALALGSVRAALGRDWAGLFRWGGATVAMLAWTIAVGRWVEGPHESTVQGHFLQPPGAPFVQLASELTHPAALVLLLSGITICLLSVLRVTRARDFAGWAAAVYALVCLGAGTDTWSDPEAYFRVMAGAVVLVFLSWVKIRDRLGSVLLVVSGATGALLFLVILRAA
ncbi:MAG TPA: hypothetical protein VG015_02210 [Candidatus Dormibacteraeota bacterium]|nr:hypothetical protein [Candidatus Dormibacteraeota bacterium]